MLNKFNERERLLIIGAIATLVLLSIIYIGKIFYEKRIELTERAIETRSGAIAIDRAISDYNYYKSLKSGEEEKVADIFAKLDDIMKRHSIYENRQSMNPTNSVILKNYNKTVIDIQLRSVPLQSVFKMIYDIEMNKQINCKVDYLSFRKPIQGKEVYDVTLKLASYSKVGKKNG